MSIETRAAPGRPTDTYTIELAPALATCERDTCPWPAEVCLCDPVTGSRRDLCGPHYGCLRDLITTDAERPGRVTDTTGSLADLKGEFPGWSIVLTGGGRLIATDAAGHTASAYCVAVLGARISEMNDRWAEGREHDPPFTVTVWSEDGGSGK